MEQLLDVVLAVRSRRLLERLQSTRSTRPSHYNPTSVWMPLHRRIRNKLEALKQSSIYRELPPDKCQMFENIYNELQSLLNAYELVDAAQSVEKEGQALKAAVLRSYAVSTLNGSHSLEKQFESLGFSVQTSQGMGVLQVDKIARYYEICKHLIRTARKHKELFSNVTTVCCQAPVSTIPRGALKPCHTHGDVQIVLHYDRNPHNPPPRVIGSSKSACFLCDLFIMKHRRYWISHSHRRLYPQWTIPDTNWMDPAQVARYQQIVRVMTKHLDRLRKNAATMGTTLGTPESRAHSPFSVTASTLSRMSSIASGSSLASDRSWGGSVTPTMSLSTAPIPSLVHPHLIELPLRPQSLSDPQPMRQVLPGEENLRTCSIRSHNQASTVGIATTLAGNNGVQSIQSSSCRPHISSISQPHGPTPLPASLLSPATSISRSVTPDIGFLSHDPFIHEFSSHAPNLRFYVGTTLFVFEFANSACGRMTIRWASDADL